MDIKKIAIIIMGLYIIISPLLIINSEIKGYNKGFNQGYSVASSSYTPLHRYQVKDIVTSTLEYERYFNVSFVGEISGFTPNGVLTLKLISTNTNASEGVLPMGMINKYAKGEAEYYIINEYWTTKGD